MGKPAATGSPTTSSSSPRPLKITTVGDGIVGKTCLLISYVNREFPTEYVPTVFDNHATNLTVDGQSYALALWDTAGQEDYERLRPLSYPNTQCFLLCFAIDNRSSYENVATKWTPELRHHCPNVPIVLVGCKMDLRQAENMQHLTYQDGKKMMKKIKASGYVECSALEMKNLEEVFFTAVRATLKKTQTKRNPCTIM